MRDSKAYATYIGMDVHARSATAAALTVSTGEFRSTRFGEGYTAADVAEWAGAMDGPVLVAYESGCTGYWLARDLAALGVDCEVVAVSTLPRSQRDRASKCDRLDARSILREMANPMRSYSCAWVPPSEVEAARDLCRLRQQASDDVRRARQRLLSFLLRRGHAWCERTRAGGLRKPSGRALSEWLDSIDLGDPVSAAVLDSQRRRLEAAEAEARRLRGMVEDLAATDRWRPYVEALAGVKGVDVATALAAAAEIGEFSRFPSGRRVSSWLGLVPRNASSGESERHGGITRAGCSHLRRALVEGLAGISRWTEAAKEPPRGSSAPPAAASAARRATARLVGRYRSLVARGKPACSARVAVASELARWIWAIGLEVERGLAG